MRESEHLNDFIDYQVKMLGKFKEWLGNEGAKKCLRS